MTFSVTCLQGNAARLEGLSWYETGVKRDLLQVALACGGAQRHGVCPAVAAHGLELAWSVTVDRRVDGRLFLPATPRVVKAW